MKNNTPIKNFDKIPRWIFKSPYFYQLNSACFNLIFFAAHTRKWDDDCTQWTTVFESSKKLRLRRTRVSEALRLLALIGIIRIERVRPRLRIRLMFSSPYDHDYNEAITGNKTKELNSNEDGLSTDKEQAYTLDVSLDVVRRTI